MGTSYAMQRLAKTSYLMTELSYFSAKVFDGFFNTVWHAFSLGGLRGQLFFDPT